MSTFLTSPGSRLNQENTRPQSPTPVNGAPTMVQRSEDEQLLEQHRDLLRKPPDRHEAQELATAPIFTMPVLTHAENLLPDGGPPPIPQYGLLGGLVDVLEGNELGESFADHDPRVFFNVAAPSSTFICGSQGSGKSHTLSCILENCLISSVAGKLPKPVTGIVFHYDTFISDDGGSPCEAAFLSSHPGIKRTYSRFNIQVAPLQINEADLNTKRILELMAVKNDEAVPLYVHSIYRILREMRMVQQASGSRFDYREFKRQVTDCGLTPSQLGPLNQRLETLESFMPRDQVDEVGMEFKRKGKKREKTPRGKDWDSKPGCLTIVDLSCPCVTPESACSLFNICLSLFVEQSVDAGRVIAHDEAHKFMNTSAEALTLTNTLLSVIRLQRHLGARVIISTQEPTISPILLDLCSITIAHRFTSPEWMATLKSHVAAVAANSICAEINGDDGESIVSEGRRRVGRSVPKLFDQIVRLGVGEALLFAPTAIIGGVRQGDMWRKTLGSGYLNIRVRNRLTTDGGKSVMAT